MIDDKEERILDVSVPLKVNRGVERIRVSFDGFAHNSKGEDRWVQTKSWLWFVVATLPLAPKHTDDEYDYNDRILNTMINERDHWVSELDKEVAVLKVRIKELELFKPLCFQEERCYDCQELLNPCAWLEKAKVSFMKGREKVVRK